jgi:hypothetical protein
MLKWIESTRSKVSFLVKFNLSNIERGKDTNYFVHS